MHFQASKNKGFLKCWYKSIKERLAYFKNGFPKKIGMLPASQSLDLPVNFGIPKNLWSKTSSLLHRKFGHSKEAASDISDLKKRKKKALEFLLFYKISFSQLSIAAAISSIHLCSSNHSSIIYGDLLRLLHLFFNHVSKVLKK